MRAVGVDVGPDKAGDGAGLDDLVRQGDGDVFLYVVVIIDVGRRGELDMQVAIRRDRGEVGVADLDGSGEGAQAVVFGGEEGAGDDAFDVVGDGFAGAVEIGEGGDVDEAVDRVRINREVERDSVWPEEVVVLRLLMVERIRGVGGGRHLLCRGGYGFDEVWIDYCCAEQQARFEGLEVDVSRCRIYLRRSCSL